MTSSQVQVDTSQLELVPNFVDKCRVCGWAKNKVDLYNWVANQVLLGFGNYSVHSKLIDYLKKNPSQAQNFKDKYGYLPEGY